MQQHSACLQCVAQCLGVGSIVACEIYGTAAPPWRQLIHEATQLGTRHRRSRKLNSSRRMAAGPSVTFFFVEHDGEC